MARTVLQPGFRFHPTDVELVMYHLKRKVTEKPVPFEAIRELDLYKFAPWDLPDKSCLQTGDLEWYFFCARDKKYANGMRANRATDIGYWKTTGRDKPVEYESRTVGMIKSLVFHIGRAPRGDRTNWVMREYRLQDQVLADAGISQDSYVLCRVFEKSGAGPKNGAQYGAPYKEEDWEEDLSSNLVPVTVTDPGSPMVPPVDPQNIVMKNRGLIIGDSTDPSSEPIPCHDCSEKHPLVDDGDVEPSLTGLKEKELPHHVGNGNNEKPDMSTIESAVESPTAEEADDIFNDLEDLSSPAELKKADSIDDLSILGSKYAPSLVLLEDDGSYMQLCDLDSPMDLPVIANAFEQLPYRDIGTNSKPELVNKFKSSEYMEDESNRDKTFLPMDGEYVELGDLISSVTVPVKSNASCPTFSSNSRLETADKFHGSISSWDNLFMDQVIENDRSYMELNDLVNPLVCPNEGDCSTGNRYDAGDLQILPKRSIRWDAGLPYQQVDNSIGGTSVSGYDGSVQNAGTPLGSAAGEGTFLPREEEHVRGKQQRLAYSRTWSLLNSIPAHPASAAEHPPINGGKGSKGSNDVFGYCGGSSSIHFKAEVIVGCKCTEEALSGKSGEEQRCSCLYCHRARMTELGKEAVVTWGGGFTFVFLLGMVMALFWVCFFAVSVKISLYTLKLILS